MKDMQGKARQSSNKPDARRQDDFETVERLI